MAGSEPISSHEVILKRVRSDDPRCIQPRAEGGYRATSFAIKNRVHERGSSCSRLLRTSPNELLSQVILQDQSPNDYLVCRIRVSDVRELSLDVVHLRTDVDPGHCEIRETPTQSFSPGRWSKLAKKTRILTAEEVETLQAGDQLVD